MIGLFSRLKKLLGKGSPSPEGAVSDVERGFLVFQHTGEVIQAESALKAAGFPAEVKGPPPELRTGCDMVVVFDLMQEPLVRSLL